ncbi:GNAT family N-acetyltransferase [Paracoccaceae bacterium GXU_MW_L88]
MSAPVRIGPVAEADRSRAVDLFYTAFGAKLGFLGPRDKACAYFADVFDLSFMTGVYLGERLVGIGASKSAADDGNGFFNETMMGGLFRLGPYRAAGLMLLHADPEPDTLYIESLSIDPAHQGRGLGAALIAYLKTEAEAQNLRGLSLDVIDTNPRAAALYQRLGFETRHRRALPAYARPFHYGFAAHLRMAQFWERNPLAPAEESVYASAQVGV